MFDTAEEAALAVARATVQSGGTAPTTRLGFKVQRVLVVLRACLIGVIAAAEGGRG